MNHKVLEKRLAVANALNQLLSKKTISDITVASICQISGVPRSTFYHYFYNINDVPTWLFQYLLEKHISVDGIDLRWEQGVEELFKDMLNWKWLFCKFFNTSSYDSIFEYTVRSGTNNFFSSSIKRLGRLITEEEAVIVEYHSYVQASLCAKWSKDGMCIPPKKMAAIMMQFLPPIMIEYISGAH